MDYLQKYLNLKNTYGGGDPIICKRPLNYFVILYGKIKNTL